MLLPASVFVGHFKIPQKYIADNTTKLNPKTFKPKSAIASKSSSSFLIIYSVPFTFAVGCHGASSKKPKRAISS